MVWFLKHIICIMNSMLITYILIILLKSETNSSDQKPSQLAVTKDHNIIQVTWFSICSRKQPWVLGAKVTRVLKSQIIVWINTSLGTLWVIRTKGFFFNHQYLSRWLTKSWGSILPIMCQERYLYILHNKTMHFCTNYV